jgi:uncharacterized protein
MNESLRKKYGALREILNEMGSVMVAYSGGVDSSCLLRVARDVLGDRAVGVLADSPSLPRREKSEALTLARRMGAKLQVVETREMENESYRRNASSRCYFCKSELFSRMLETARRLGVREIAYGAIVDDAGDHRPGARAAGRFRVRSPLQEAGLSKREVREIARGLGLPNWDKPAAACLASRIPYFDRVNREKLSMIERAEEVLRRLGFVHSRVRHHGSIARIEVPAGDLARLAEPGTRDEIVNRLKEIGFTYITLDLEGYRTGSLNEGLPEEQGSA